MTRRPRGHSLTESFGEHLVAPSMVYLKTANGAGVELLPYSAAEALLEQVTVSPLVDVTGDLVSGFAWPVPGAIPRCSQTVTPLAAPIWPNTQRTTVVLIELWWPPDGTGYRRVRSFLGLVNNPFDAYLIACCLWSTRSTGGGAEAAFLYGPDRRTAYRINEFAKACSHVPADTIVRFAATAANRDTTDPLPDQYPKKGALVQEERINDRLTYTGSSLTEIVEVLREHADSREASHDPTEARALRLAADDFENGTRTEYLGRAHYRIAAADAAGGC